jgi:hypothetical protein
MDIIALDNGLAASSMGWLTVSTVVEADILVFGRTARDTDMGHTHGVMVRCILEDLLRAGSMESACGFMPMAPKHLLITQETNVSRIAQVR